MSWYTAADKQRAYRRAAKALRALAADLGFSSDTYQVRPCYGGPGVSGEAIFHGETLYISLPLFPQPGVVQVYRGYFRSCNGRKDYTGGRNFWFEGYPTPSAEVIRRALPHLFPSPCKSPSTPTPPEDAAA
jgi:hypothetical protein